MATKNIVPRANAEGGIGTAAKAWGAVRAVAIYLGGVALGNASTKNTGTTTGTVALGDHAHTGVYEAVDANIARVASISSWTKPQDITLGTLSSSSGAVAVDESLAAAWAITLTENSTFSAPSNPPASGKIRPFTIDITQHASAAKTVAFNAAYKFPGGVAFVMSATLSARDRLYCIGRSDGTVDVVGVPKFS